MNTLRSYYLSQDGNQLELPYSRVGLPSAILDSMKIKQAESDHWRLKFEDLVDRAGYSLIALHMIAVTLGIDDLDAVRDDPMIVAEAVKQLAEEQSNE